MSNDRQQSVSAAFEYEGRLGFDLLVTYNRKHV